MILTAEGTEHVQQIAGATGIFNATWVMIALPLFGALVLLCGGKRTDSWGHILGCATVFGSFVTFSVIASLLPSRVTVIWADPTPTARTS